jgi:hypothetical protein
MTFLWSFSVLSLASAVNLPVSSITFVLNDDEKIVTDGSGNRLILARLRPAPITLSDQPLELWRKNKVFQKNTTALTPAHI